MTINCRPGTAWAELQAIEIHTLSEDRYDRRGRVCSLIFKKFPNQEYQRYSIILAVRALTSLLASHYSLMDVDEYAYDEMNDCWIYYNHPLDSHRELCMAGDVVVIGVNHKYWSRPQIYAFTEMIKTIAFLYSASVTNT